MSHMWLKVLFNIFKMMLLLFTASWTGFQPAGKGGALAWRWHLQPVRSEVNHVIACAWYALADLQPGGPMQSGNCSMERSVFSAFAGVNTWVDTLRLTMSLESFDWVHLSDSQLLWTRGRDLACAATSECTGTWCPCTGASRSSPQQVPTN